MKKLARDTYRHVDAISPATAQAVLAAYSERRALGLSELASLHAALIVLLEHVPSWPLRMSAGMVRRLIADSRQNRQAV